MEKVGIYVHIPFCKSRCNYCGFCSSTDFLREDGYIGALKKEIKERLNGVAADTVYIGGGTPSSLKRSSMSDILLYVHENCTVLPDAEITVECNPDSADRELFALLKMLGVNRISMGLQSADDRILKRAGRIHTLADFDRAVAACRDAGIDNISADIMLGLPGSKVKDIELTLDYLLGRNIEHISLYSLKVEENTRLYDSGYCPDEDLQADMYEKCREVLGANGFSRYEVSNFAKNGHCSRHNYKYWSYDPYIGIGAAAHSFFGNVRRANTSNIDKYILGHFEDENVTLSKSEQVEEFIMLGLRTEKGIDLKRFSELFGYSLLKDKEKEIESLLSRGLVCCDESFLRLSDDAFYIMNNIIIELI